MIQQEQLLSFVRQQGPILPSQLVSTFGLNTLILGAALAELVREKKLLISSAKIGGSPVYYLSDQRPRLEMLYKYLNEKDKRTYDLLKEKKVVRDSEQTPLVRVSLRNIKDFAVPLEVTHSDTLEIFWKWYLASQEEALQCIKTLLGGSQQNKAKEVAEPSPHQVSSPSLYQQPPSQERLVQEVLLTPQPVQKHLPSQLPLSVVGLKDDLFFDKVTRFFTEKGIVLEQIKPLRKKGDFEAVVLVPTPLGHVRYFCRAKAKKKLNEGDLASVYLTSETQKLPALYIASGTLTKGAQKKLNEELKNMKVIMIP